MARRGLPLKLQVRLFYLFEREADLAAGGFQADDAIGKACQGAFPMALVFDRRAQGDPGLLPPAPPPLALPPPRAGPGSSRSVRFCVPHAQRKNAGSPARVNRFDTPRTIVQ